MPSKVWGSRVPGRWGLCVLALFGSLLAAGAAETPRPEQALAPGETREQRIAVGEVHPYRVTVEPGSSLLVRVDQQSIGLVLSLQGPEGGKPVGIGGGGDRWGQVVAVLDAAGAYRVEVRPREAAVWPGRYGIRVESLPGKTSEERSRRQAFDLLYRAGRESFDPTPEARKRAIATYREALTAWQGLGDRAWEAEIWVCLGFLERAGDLTTASADFQAALALWRDLGEARREAEATGELGQISLHTDASKAKETLERARDAWQQLGEPLEEAEVRFNLCSFERSFGSLPAALDCFTENRELFRSLGDDSHEGSILNFVGGIYDSQGELDQALASYGQALDWFRRLGDRRSETAILNNIARVERRLGDWQQALRFYAEAREIQSLVGDRALEALYLNNIGYLYDDVGLPERALPYLEAALKLRQEAGDRIAEITTRNNLGRIWMRVGEPKKALAEHRQALKLALALKDVGQQAVTRLQRMEVYRVMGDAAAALREAEVALELLAHNGDRRTATSVLHQRGRALLLEGRARQALSVLTEALASRRAVRDRAGEAETLVALAEAERATGDRAGARGHAQEAVARIEELRGGFSNPDLRASFLARRRQAFSLQIDLLLDPSGPTPSRDDVRDAFAVSERAHARSLLDALVRAGAVYTASAGTGELLERRRSLLEKLSKKGDERWKLAGEKAEAADREIDALETQILGMEAEIRQKSRRPGDRGECETTRATERPSEGARIWLLPHRPTRPTRPTRIMRTFG